MVRHEPRGPWPVGSSPGREQRAGRCDLAIFLCVLALTVAGVLALWGDDLGRLVWPREGSQAKDPSRQNERDIL